MEQLVKLQKLGEEFIRRETRVVAVSNEEKSIAEHEKLYGHFEGDPPFDAGADLSHRSTGAYARTTCYLIDREGTIVQVFPMEIYRRAPWWAVLNEMDRILRK